MNKYYFSFLRPIYGYTLYTIHSDSLEQAKRNLKTVVGEYTHLHVLKQEIYGNPIPANSNNNP